MGSNEFGFCGWRFFTAHFGTGPLNSFYDVVITRTATKVAGNAPADFIFGWIIVMFQEFHTTHDHAWCTESAVQTVIFFETFLKWMKGSSLWGKSFNCSDTFAIGLNGEYGAAFNALAVKQDSTGTTAAGIATYVGAGHAQDFPDHVHQKQPWLYIKGVFGAIYSYIYCFVHRV
jgi:hypothetical protein